MTVVSLPVVLTTDKHTISFDYGRLRGHIFRALENRDARQSITEKLFDAAIHYFEETLHVQVLSILNLAGSWVITVPNDTTFSALPYFLAQTPCHYKHVSDNRQAKEAAFRYMEPVGTVWDQVYQNKTFGANISDGTIVNPQKIQGIRSAFTMRRFDEVSINNPFSGYCVGLHLGVEKTRMPVDENGLEHKWVTNEWSYFGNAMNQWNVPAVHLF